MGSNTAENHYVLLGVAQNATVEEIRSGYKKMSLRWHPDKNRDNVEAATAVFQNIVNAYDVLGDPSKRREYDTMHRLSNASSQHRSNPVKAAKSNKHTSSSTHFPSGTIPVVSISDQNLATLISARKLNSFTMKELKVMLVERRLKVSGNKQEWVERLVNYVMGDKKVQEPRAPPPPPQQPNEKPHQQAPGIPEGYFVRLHGLNSDDYNGKMAVVKSSINENGRQMVELLGKVAFPLVNQIHVKPGNMSVVNRIVVDDESDDNSEDDDGLFHQIRQQQAQYQAEQQAQQQQRHQFQQDQLRAQQQAQEQQRHAQQQAREKQQRDQQEQRQAQQQAQEQQRHAQQQAREKQQQDQQEQRQARYQTPQEHYQVQYQAQQEQYQAPYQAKQEQYQAQYQAQQEQAQAQLEQRQAQLAQQARGWGWGW